MFQYSVRRPNNRLNRLELGLCDNPKDGVGPCVCWSDRGVGGRGRVVETFVSFNIAGGRTGTYI